MVKEQTKQNKVKTVKKHPSRQNIKVAVDNCIFTVINDKLYILLIQMKKKPFTRKWALPGGLIADNEKSEDSARRILKEQTGVSNVYLEQLYTFDKVSRDPFGRVISVAYFALIPNRGINLRTISKYAAVKWYKFKDVPKLAYDHSEIIKYAKKRLEWKVKYSNVAWSLLPEKFTFTELHNVYEAILGKKLDRRNFRKKFLALKLIKSTGKRIMWGVHRPAMTYQFKSKKPKIVDIF